MTTLGSALGSVLVLLTTAMTLHPQEEAATDDTVVRSELFGIEFLAPLDWQLNKSENESAGVFVATMHPVGDPVVQISIKAGYADSTASAEKLLNQAQQVVDQAGPGYQNDKAVELKFADGQIAPGLSVEISPGDGKTYQLSQFYFVKDGTQYVLESRAYKKDYLDYAKEFEDCFASIQFLAVDLDHEFRQLQELAQKCGKRIDWHEGWDSAAKQAKREGKWVLAYFRKYSGFTIADENQAAAFMNDDIVAMIQSRMVPVRLLDPMNTPLADYENYGFSLSAFGSSILLCQPDGKVVADFCHLDEIHLDRQLFETLQRLESEPDQETSNQELFQQGQLHELVQRLQQPSTLEQNWLLAESHRRLWNARAALLSLKHCQSYLETIEEKSARETWSDRLRIANARIHAHLGDFSTALAGFSAVGSESSEMPAALYWQGMMLMQMQKQSLAEPIWDQLIENHKDSPWAWRAASRKQNPSFELGFVDCVEWATENVFDSLRVPAPDQWSSSKAKIAEREALEFLLKHQQSNGAWISPTEAARTFETVPNPFTDAMTAIGIQALLPYRDDPDVLAAIEMALGYLRAAQRRHDAFGDMSYYMDYSIWRNAYALWCLTDCHDQQLVSNEEFSSWAQTLISGLGEKQRRSGGWSYYVTGDLNAASGAPDQSICFVTAAILVALKEAEDAGIELPAKVLDPAVECLTKMRNPNGTHEYFLFEGQEPSRATAEPGAAGRAPLCSYAEWRVGTGSKKAIQKALDMFLEHRDELGRERGKSVMHAGQDGQGSHYVLFDYKFAAKAVTALPNSQQAKYRTKILSEVLKMRRADGSYLDNPMMGRYFGTAAALIAIHELLETSRSY